MRKQSDEPQIARIILPKQRDIFEIHTPYNEEFISKLKAAIPARERRFDFANKFWIANIKHLEKVKNLCLGHYDELEQYDAAKGQMPPEKPKRASSFDPIPPAPIVWDAATQIIKAAPTEALKELFHKSVKANHPDVGGNTRDFQSLLAAWDEIKKVRGIE